MPAQQNSTADELFDKARIKALSRKIIQHLLLLQKKHWKRH